MKEASVLRVLKNLKEAVNGDNELGIHYFPKSGLSFHSRLPICWHVFANTSEQDIKSDYLYPVFKEMGLDCTYPVECQLVSDEWMAAEIFKKCGSMYSLERRGGKERLALLDSLIAYFENKVQVLSEVQEAEKDLGDM